MEAIKPPQGYLILPCTCPHREQDRRYGKDQRVHNRCKTSAKLPGARCTVCAAEKTLAP